MCFCMISLLTTWSNVSFFRYQRVDPRDNLTSYNWQGRHVDRWSLTTEEKEKKEVASEEEPSDADSITRKFGLEAGLWKIFTSKDNSEEGTKGNKTNKAKELLAQYGGAYLVTSISLSLVSFALCYALVQAGADVPALLEKVGIRADGTGEKVGTFALAYAAHKAASPIRFPPTVALTPIVAGWFGKKPAGGDNTQPK
ncbi:unnamed protein product [Sphagnum compactum]